MLRPILNKSWRQLPTKQQLYGHPPRITKTIKIRRTRHPGHCWRSRDKLISDVLLWTPSHGRAKAGRPARTYKQQFCADSGCSPEDQQEAIDNREVWRERVRDIRADSATWWWWFWKEEKFTSQNFCLVSSQFKWMITSVSRIELTYYLSIPLYFFYYGICLLQPSCPEREREREREGGGEREREFVLF